MNKQSMRQINKLCNMLNYLKENNKYFSMVLNNYIKITNENVLDIYKEIKPINKAAIVNNFPIYLDTSFSKNFDSSSEMVSELLNVSNLSINHDKYIKSGTGSKRWSVEATTGTTGRPFPIVKTLEERIIESSYLFKCRKQYFEDATINNGFYLIHQTDPVLKSINYRDDKQQHKHFDTILDRMSELKPGWIFTSALLIKNLAKHIRDNNKYNILKELNLHFIETTGQRLLDEDKKIIADAFGSKVVDQYGCREVWNIAYECKNNNLHLNTDYLIVDLVDEQGNIIENQDNAGEVILTGLTNRTMPLIKYYLGDLAKIVYNKCDCGLPSPIIVLEEGRKKEKLKNTKCYGTSVFRRVLRAIHFHEEYNDINRIKIIQDEEFHLSVYIDKNKINDTDFEKRFLEVSNFIIPGFENFRVDFKYYYPFENNDQSILKEQIFISNVID